MATASCTTQYPQLYENSTPPALAGLGANFYAICILALIACAWAAVNLRVKCGDSSRIALTQEQVNKFLDSTILLSALVLAFAITLPTGVGYDDLVAADKRLPPEFGSCSNAGWKEPISRTFLSTTMNAVTYTGTGLLFSYLSSVGMLFVGNVDEDLLEKVWFPLFAFICIMIAWGVVQFVFAFLFYVNIVLPTTYNRSFVNAWALCSAFFAVIPLLMLKSAQEFRNKADKTKLVGGNTVDVASVDS